MKRYIIDTNALISYVTDRNPEQQRKVAGIFQEAAKLRGVILCPQNVLTEFIFVLDRVYGVPKKEIQMMAKDFLAMPGVEMVHEIDFALRCHYVPHVDDFELSHTYSRLVVTLGSIQTFPAELEKKICVFG